ncbi:MAG TPA: low-specificity L-threonine aldolase [Anaerolineae bacterium]|nr:low-specificity L-threonine aldolase [Anaerolineae bacterium]HIQ04733.1 low-specificity L-threonine aldolase [Anaerolineae bacterium]
MHVVDLRSDTITRPTPAMRRAMAEAEVGDDVFGEDPTVNRLEAMAAEQLGKEAGLFVASGTMGNLVSLMTHCGRGDEVILGHLSHTFHFEQGGAAAVGGIHSYPVRNLPDGRLDLDEVEAAIRPDNVHFPRTKLISVENTHNRCGGAVLTPEYMHQVGQLARRHGIRVHVDGARIFNAAVALGVDVKELAADADSVTFCLSKGLAAPVGSVIVGSREFIAEARRNRKVLGGGMRQAGIIAAAGIVALNEMVDRLAEDHVNAQRLAEGIAELPGVVLDPSSVQTNIVIFELHRDDLTPAELAQRLQVRGVRLLPIGGRRLRAVTNYHITRDDIDWALRVFADVLGMC